MNDQVKCVRCGYSFKGTAKKYVKPSESMDEAKRYKSGAAERQYICAYCKKFYESSMRVNFDQFS